MAYLSGNSRPEFPIDTDLQEMLSRQNGLIDAENQRQEADCDVPYPESQNDGLSTGTSAEMIRNRLHWGNH